MTSPHAFEALQHVRKRRAIDARALDQIVLAGAGAIGDGGEHHELAQAELALLAALGEPVSGDLLGAVEQVGSRA